MMIPTNEVFHSITCSFKLIPRVEFAYMTDFLLHYHIVKTLYLNDLVKIYHAFLKAIPNAFCEFKTKWRKHLLT